MQKAAREKRKKSRFQTAPDGRLIIDVDDDEGQMDQQRVDADDSEEEELRREDLKDLMETLSLSQRAKNKRKRAFDDENDDDDFNDDRDEKQSFRSKYRCELFSINILRLNDRFSFSWWWWNSSNTRWFSERFTTTNETTWRSLQSKSSFSFFLFSTFDSTRRFFLFFFQRGTGGDRKLANKHDPYAYIKLNFNALNKRFVKFLIDKRNKF